MVYERYQTLTSVSALLGSHVRWNHPPPFRVLHCNELILVYVSQTTSKQREIVYFKLKLQLTRQFRWYLPKPLKLIATPCWQMLENVTLNHLVEKITNLGNSRTGKCISKKFTVTILMSLFGAYHNLSMKTAADCQHKAINWVGTDF